MAPKYKFTKEEMVAAAVRVVQKNGMDGLTAKSMAAELGASTQPIFTAFETMEDVKNEVRAAAEDKYAEYTARGLQESVPFFGVGMQHIRFAEQEPELYRVLFFEKTNNGKDGAFAAMERSKNKVLPSLMGVYKISAAAADRYFRDLWLVVHSLATLIVTGENPYSEQEIGRILTGFSVSIYKSIREIPGFVDDSYDRDEVFRKLLNEK